MQRSIDRLKQTSQRCREHAQKLRHQANSLDDKAVTYLEAADMIIEEFARENMGSATPPGADQIMSPRNLRPDIRGVPPGAGQIINKPESVA